MNYQKSKKLNLSKKTCAVTTNAVILICLGILTVFCNTAYAQAIPVIDPSLEVFRVRCQIDVDIDPATGLQAPKVQIQGKARAELLDGLEVGIMLENVTATNPPLPSVVNTTFELGSASADWDTFPDPGSLNPATVIPGDFVAADETIRITTQVISTGQTVRETGTCADKTSAQFKQDTKGVCKLKDYLRDKCKPGDILPDGTTLP
jgi:hypothetical protein